MPKIKLSEVEALSFVVYAADLWEHVCPTIRITRPAELAGVNIIRGNEWGAGDLEIRPAIRKAGRLCKG